MANDRKVPTAVYYEQAQYNIRCEWAEQGIVKLSPGSDVIVIVDTLSFSTCVDIATANGAIVYPYRFKDASAEAYAQSVGGVVATGRSLGPGFSLSPASLVDIPAGTRLVLPSPNGSTLSLSTGSLPTFAGCLRNARAVAAAARAAGRRIAVIPAGERWDDGAVRFAVEDLLGAGAIVRYLGGTRSPEAALAETAFLGVQPNLARALRECVSGRELVERGFEADVMLASELDSSTNVPMLKEGAYVSALG